MRLKNKVAVVTGASRGIGKAIAECFGKEGASLVLCSRNLDAVEAVAKPLRDQGCTVVAIAADVSVREQAENLITSAQEHFTRIDILVNNAGITRDSLLVRMKDEDWDQVIQTNLTGASYTIRAIARIMMKQRSGSIINISSVVGITGNAGQANYAAAKAGLIGLTKSAAKELARRGIRVNAIAPGFIETDMTSRLAPQDQERITTQIPMAVLGKPEDVAYGVLFLASDESCYVTGQVLQIDGGMVM